MVRWVPSHKVPCCAMHRKENREMHREKQRWGSGLIILCDNMSQTVLCDRFPEDVWRAFLITDLNSTKFLHK
jgi:hypothetical protein